MRPDMVNGNRLVNGDTWQRRAIRATMGTATQEGDGLMLCFVLAVLGLQSGVKPPRFGRVGRIDADGLLYSNMQDSNYKIYRDHCLGPVDTVVDNFRGLADHLKLEDWERLEMFDAFKKWIFHDARANETVAERGLLQ